MVFASYWNKVFLMLSSAIARRAIGRTEDSLSVRMVFKEAAWPECEGLERWVKVPDCGKRRSVGNGVASIDTVVTRGRRDSVRSTESKRSIGSRWSS